MSQIWDIAGGGALGGVIGAGGHVMVSLVKHLGMRRVGLRP
jgi:hypothetical protein